ncbi:MAG: GNAT family N-acetyltransferase [Acidobacteriota bacterium]|nr:GNAT family N-acetyltransferase [Acidobacteriota bacterium]
MVPTFTTRRLLLQPLGMADAPEIQLQFPHWQIVRHLDEVVPWPYPQNGAAFFCQQVALPAMQQGVAFHWSIRLHQASAPLIGVISLTLTGESHRGFWIGLPWQGLGYVTEACEPVTAYWFDDLQQPVLRITKSAGNVASRRVSLRQGMRVVRTFTRRFVGGPEPAGLWELTRHE